MKTKYYALGALVGFGWTCVFSAVAAVVVFAYPGLQVSDYPAAVIVYGVVMLAGVFIIGRRYTKWAERQ